MEKCITFFSLTPGQNPGGRPKTGIQSVEWDAADMAGGVYFYKPQADGFVATKKLVLMKQHTPVRPPRK